MYQRLENRIFGTEFLHTDGEDYYQYCSAIPVGTLLAQTFDTELLEEAGRMIGRRAGGVRRDPLACTGHEHPPQSALRTQLRILF